MLRKYKLGFWLALLSPFSEQNVGAHSGVFPIKSLKCQTHYTGFCSSH